MSASNLTIKRIVVTEKAVDLEKDRKYVFMVAHEATKNEIKKAIKKLYGVDPVKVAIIRRKATTRRFRNTTSKTGSYKKAVVTLKQGQKIDIHSV